MLEKRTMAFNQTYHAMDWCLSFERIRKADEINDQFLAAAKFIQKHIDEIDPVLDECR